jgi:hypothetical protein
MMMLGISIDFPFIVIPSVVARNGYWLGDINRHEVEGPPQTAYDRQRVGRESGASATAMTKNSQVKQGTEGPACKDLR